MCLIPLDRWRRAGPYFLNSSSKIRKLFKCSNSFRNEVKFSFWYGQIRKNLCQISFCFAYFSATQNQMKKLSMSAYSSIEMLHSSIITLEILSWFHYKRVRWRNILRRFFGNAYLRVIFENQEFSSNSWLIVMKPWTMERRIQNGHTR
jgi:hypothetical protein